MNSLTRFIIIILLLFSISVTVYARWFKDAAPASTMATSTAIDTSLKIIYATSTDAPSQTKTPLKTAAPTQAAPLAPRPALTYTVQAGDTVSSIAQRFNLTISTILSANNLSATSLLRLEQRLVIPAKDGTGYLVQSGDTLSSIAAKSGQSAAAIAAANNLSLTSTLKIGQRLTLPGTGATTVTKSPLAKATAPASPKTPTKTTSKTTSKKTVVSPAKVSSVTWTAGALAELRKIPYSLRASVKAKVSSYAKTHGVRVITKQYYLKLRI